MRGAYLMDVLVADHFEKFVQNQGGRRALNLNTFGRACDALKINWRNDDSDKVFSWIFKAFNGDSYSGGKGQQENEVTSAEIDQAVYLEN
jgi:hypothetical protein